MEYKGLIIKQSKNRNVIINTADGGMIVVSTSKKYLNDNELKKIADKYIDYLSK